jgi:thiol-disulfide isomerase/thioredoxin
LPRKRGASYAPARIRVTISDPVPPAERLGTDFPQTRNKEIPMKALLPAALAAGLFLAPAVTAQDGSGPKVEKVKDDKAKDKDKQKTDKDMVASIAVGSEVPGRITLADIKGNEHQLAKYRGKIVVVDFWSIDCPWSVGYEARLKRLHEKYSAKDVVFLAVDANTTEIDRGSDRPYGRIQKYVEEKTIPYPILIDDHNVVADLFGAKTTPHVFILDQKGVLRYAGGIDDDPKGEMGEKATNHVVAALDALLAGKEVPVATTKPAGCSIKRVAADEQKAWLEKKKHEMKDMKDKDKVKENPGA